MQNQCASYASWSVKHMGMKWDIGSTVQMAQQILQSMICKYDLCSETTVMQMSCMIMFLFILQIEVRNFKRFYLQLYSASDHCLNHVFILHAFL